MQVHRGIPEHADTAAVLTIGNFDGVHLGHQALLSLLTDKARELGLPAVVLTFEPHPREYFSPADAPARLASLREKLLLLAAAASTAPTSAASTRASPRKPPSLHRRHPGARPRRAPPVHR
jgi:FAD synthase